jgi:uncharacterized membrane protein YoaK (UPF0700 family)
VTADDGVAATGAWKDARHGPLPAMLLVLTLVTGIVDAVSYLTLGHVFVANMTGNVVFLGFAVADAKEFSIGASLAATAAFLLGALAGGRIGSQAGRHRGRLLALSVRLEVLLVGAALATSLSAAVDSGGPAAYALIVLLALAMGLQNATARRLGVPDLTTTVLTLTLTGLAADSTLAGGGSGRPGRRLAATGIMFLGAALGALAIFRAGPGAALALALALLIGNAVAAQRHAHSQQAWTAP